MVSQTNDQFWWLTDKDPHEQLHGYVRRLLTDQRYRAEDNLRHMRLYGNQETLGFNLRDYSRVQPLSSENRVTLNVIQSMADTVKSKITKNQPKPMYLTDGGDWSEQRRAKKLNQFTQGQFYANKVYEVGPQIFLDACVFGTGVLKVFRDGNDTCIERVFPNEIIVDDSEAIYGQPRQMHQGKWVHKEVLKMQFPKFATKIDEAEQALLDQPFSLSREAGMIYVLESWHLPSKKDAKDGKHVISINGATLHNEKYEKCYFPFVFMKWTPRLLGFFGQGLAEQLQGLQVEINKILRIIQVSMHLTCVPRVLIEHGSRVVAEHINNKIGAQVRYTGVKPEFWMADGAIPQELFNHLDRLYQRAFEIAGISQLSAQSKKPTGLDSGKALRTFNDIESERFFDVGRRYEDFYMELARQLLEVARDIDKDTGKYEVKVPGKKNLKMLKLKECDLSEDRYIMQAFPVSALSKSPAARLAEVQEMINSGIISPDVGRQLLEFPDLTAYEEHENAAKEDIEYTLDQIIDEDNYLPPEPYQDLQYGIPYMQKCYLQMRMQGLPEKKLEAIRIWIEDAQNLLTPPPDLAQDPNAMLPPEEAPLDPAMANGLPPEGMMAPPAPAVDPAMLMAMAPAV
jgi:hypothetical protein